MASLTNLQMELLRLYGNNLSESALLEVKGLLAKYFAEKASSHMDDFWDEKRLTEQLMVDWANEHNRSENRSRH